MSKTKGSNAIHNKPQHSLFVRLKSRIGLKFIRDPIHSGMALQLLLMIPIGIKPPKHSNRNQDYRHDNHHRRGDLPLPGNSLMALQKGGDAVVLERHQRFGLRPTKASLAQGCILSSQLLDLSLELGDFIKF